MKPLILITFMFTLFSCSKNSKQACPPRTYTISCEESYPDFDFPGYLTGTNVYSIESNCLEDAIKKAQEMSYGSGQIYKRCQVVR